MAPFKALTAIRRVNSPILGYAVMAAIGVACVTFKPSNAGDSILPMLSEEGACTAWSVAPERWMTAKHCLANDPGPWQIGGIPSEPVAVDPYADLAMVTGPAGRPLPVATRPPIVGDVVTTWGYGMSQPTLLIFSAVVVSTDADFFSNSPHEFIVSGANGMPGMSGGPILYHGKVVSQISGGGPAPSHAHLVGSGVSFAALAAFVRLHAGTK